MPQMAPIKWLTLFLIFSMSFMMYNFINYYMYMPSSPSLNPKNFKKTLMSWKW